MMSIELLALIKWMEGLTESQIRCALVDVITHCIEVDDIRFYGDSRGPYWGSNGENVAPGEEDEDA